MSCLWRGHLDKSPPNPDILVTSTPPLARHEDFINLSAMSGTYPYACPYCGRDNTVSVPGNSCGRVKCNALRSANVNVLRPLVKGLSEGLSKGTPQK